MRTTAVDMGVDFSRGEDRKKNPHGSAKEKRRRKSLFLGYARIFSECCSVMGRNKFPIDFPLQFHVCRCGWGFGWDAAAESRSQKSVWEFSKKTRTTKNWERSFSRRRFSSTSLASLPLPVCLSQIFTQPFGGWGSLKLKLEQLFMCVSNNSTLSHPLILLIGCRFSAIFRRKTGGWVNIGSTQEKKKTKQIIAFRETHHPPSSV